MCVRKIKFSKIIAKIRPICNFEVGILKDLHYFRLIDCACVGEINFKT